MSQTPHCYLPSQAAPCQSVSDCVEPCRERAMPVWAVARIARDCTMERLPTENTGPRHHFGECNVELVSEVGTVPQTSSYHSCRINVELWQPLNRRYYWRSYS